MGRRVLERREEVAVMRREGKAVEITKVEFHREADPPYATVHGFLNVNYVTAVNFNLILGTEDTAALDRLLESACERIRHDVGEAMRDRAFPADGGPPPETKRVQKATKVVKKGGKQ